jgi:hypothetical protein
VSLLIFVPSVPGFPLALVTWHLARHDLLLMRAGKMDPHDLNATEEARFVALYGVFLSGCTLFGYGYLLVYWMTHGP